MSLPQIHGCLFHILTVMLLMFANQQTTRASLVIESQSQETVVFIYTPDDTTQFQTVEQMQFVTQSGQTISEPLSIPAAHVDFDTTINAWIPARVSPSVANVQQYDDFAVPLSASNMETQLSNLIQNSINLASAPPEPSNVNGGGNGVSTQSISDFKKLKQALKTQSFIQGTTVITSPSSSSSSSSKNKKKKVTKSSSNSDGNNKVHVQGHTDVVPYDSSSSHDNIYTDTQSIDEIGQDISSVAKNSHDEAIIAMAILAGPTAGASLVFIPLGYSIAAALKTNTNYESCQQNPQLTGYDATWCQYANGNITLYNQLSNSEQNLNANLLLAKSAGTNQMQTNLLIAQSETQFETVLSAMQSLGQLTSTRVDNLTSVLALQTDALAQLNASTNAAIPYETSLVTDIGNQTTIVEDLLAQATINLANVQGNKGRAILDTLHNNGVYLFVL